MNGIVLPLGMRIATINDSKRMSTNGIKPNCKAKPANMRRSPPPETDNWLSVLCIICQREEDYCMCYCKGQRTS